MNQAELSYPRDLPLKPPGAARAGSAMRRRLVGAGLATVGALLLVIGAFHPRWLSQGPYGPEGVAGLLEVEAFETRFSHSELFENSFFEYLAGTTFALGLLAAAVLAMCLGLALALRRWEEPAPLSSLAIGISIAAFLCASVALAANPYLEFGWRLGPGFPLYALGATAGLVGAVFLGRTESAYRGWD